VRRSKTWISIRSSRTFGESCAHDERRRHPARLPGVAPSTTSGILASPNRTRTWTLVVDTNATAPPDRSRKHLLAFVPSNQQPSPPTRPAVSPGGDPRPIIVNPGVRRTSVPDPFHDAQVAARGWMGRQSVRS
jgi:hypothetical protein